MWNRFFDCFENDSDAFLFEIGAQPLTGKASRLALVEEVISGKFPPLLI